MNPTPIFLVHPNWVDGSSSSIITPHICRQQWPQDKCGSKKVTSKLDFLLCIGPIALSIHWICLRQGRRSAPLTGSQKEPRSSPSRWWRCASLPSGNAHRRIVIRNGQNGPLGPGVFDLATENRYSQVSQGGGVAYFCGSMFGRKFQSPKYYCYSSYRFK